MTISSCPMFLDPGRYVGGGFKRVLEFDRPKTAWM